MDQLNDALLAKANEHKLVKLDKLRADTTVVEANVAYPTDSGLLAHAVTLLVTLVARVHTAGGATRTKVRDRRRAAGHRARAIAAKLKLRNDDAKTAVLRITGELADLAEVTADEAERVLRNARRALRPAGVGQAGRAGRPARHHHRPYPTHRRPDPPAVVGHHPRRRHPPRVAARC